MPDDAADPFEQFKQEREEEEEEEEEEEDRNEVHQEEQEAKDTEDSPSGSESPSLIDALKEYTDREGRPSGFWSHTFDTDDAETDDIQEASDEKPGGFSSHRLAPEQQEELNEEAKNTADPPEGFESHRMDQDLNSDSDESQHDDNAQNSEESS